MNISKIYIFIHSLADGENPSATASISSKQVNPSLLAANCLCDLEMLLLFIFFSKQNSQPNICIIWARLFNTEKRKPEEIKKEENLLYHLCLWNIAPWSIFYSALDTVVFNIAHLLPIPWEDGTTLQIRFPCRELLLISLYFTSLQ